jgi:hypothetical protein
MEPDEAGASYILGPMTIEEWFVESEELKSMIMMLLKNRPYLNVETQTVTTDIKDFYYIVVNIDEYKDNKEDGGRE